jgi:hypothetical protein
MMTRDASKANGVLAIVALALGLCACGGSDDNTVETRAVPTAYPDVTDISHSTIRAANIFEGFFTAKSQHMAAPMVSFFAPKPDTVLYVDAGLGFSWPSQDSLLQIWSSPSFANGPPTALSYPTRVVGDEHSAVIEFIDTPELLGHEFRFLSSITFDGNGKIIRWVDYWDGRSSSTHLPIGTLGPYPTDFHDNVVNASPRILQVSQALQSALQSGDAAAAAQLFTADALYEDMALHTRVEGQSQIQRYLQRGLGLLPYGTGSSMAHVSGSDQGGGFEWHASASAAPLPRGISALELNGDGKITRFTTVYDSFQLSDAQYASLVALAAE